MENCYRTYTTILKKCLQTAQKIKKLKYIQNSKNKCQATWRTISSNTSDNTKENDIQEIQFNNNLFSDPQRICDILNNHFIHTSNPNSNHLSNISNSFSNTLPVNSNTLPVNNNTMFLRPVDSTEIYRIIMTLKNSKASGYDSITTKVLKSCAQYICIPLAHVINLSFVEGIFPEKLKLSIVKPLFKKGNKQDPSNYRPIALIPVISKILEKAFYTRMYGFLTKYDILCPEQYGFRGNKSTTQACFELIKYVTESINNNIPVASVFLDMSKAFDSVNHSKLLCKIERYGVRGRAYDWLKSYLQDRAQCTEISRLTKINNNILKQTYRSEYKSNCTGIPQGSILGPLLFLLYVNDLPKATVQKSILFADDTTLVIKCFNRITFKQDVEKSLVDIINWLNKNNLSISISKTKYIQFISYNSNRLPMTIKHNNETVDEVASLKFLGVTIDKHLNWKEHIDQVCNKLNRFVFALRRLRNTVSVEAAITAYHGYVSSVLSYGLILWGNSVDVDRVFKIQKKCVRAVCNARIDDSCIPLFKKLNILPLPCLYIRDVCVFVCNNQSHFKTRGEIRDRQTRQKVMNQLYKPPARKAIYSKNVFNMCIELFNNLPDEIKLLRGNSFKHRLSTWLLDKCFYSVKSYLNPPSVS
jgi:hypothetical protein